MMFALKLCDATMSSCSRDEQSQSGNVKSDALSLLHLIWPSLSADHYPSVRKGGGEFPP